MKMTYSVHAYTAPNYGWQGWVVVDSYGRIVDDKGELVVTHSPMAQTQAWLSMYKKTARKLTKLGKTMLGTRGTTNA